MAVDATRYCTRQQTTTSTTSVKRNTPSIMAPLTALIFFRILDRFKAGVVITAAEGTRAAILVVSSGVTERDRLAEDSQKSGNARVRTRGRKQTPERAETRYPLIYILQSRNPQRRLEQSIHKPWRHVHHTSASSAYWSVGILAAKAWRNENEAGTVERRFRQAVLTHCTRV